MAYVLVHTSCGNAAAALPHEPSLDMFLRVQRAELAAVYARFTTYQSGCRRGSCWFLNSDRYDMSSKEFVTPGTYLKMYQILMVISLRNPECVLLVAVHIAGSGGPQ
jgi:hypothetical protein